MRLALLTALLALALGVSSAAAAVDVTPNTQGAGSIVIGGVESEVDCDPSSDDRQVVPCLETVPVPDNETLTLKAVPSPTPTGHWKVVGWEGAACETPPVTVDVCVISDLLVDESAVTPTAVFDDVKGPEIGEVTEIRPGPAGTVTFQFTADEDAADGATFTCALTGGTPTDCSTGTVTYAELAAGAYAFTVQGVDASGQSGEVSTNEFTVTAPSTGETSGSPTILPPPSFPPIPRVLGPNAITAKVSAKRVLSLGKVRLGCPAVAMPCTASATLKGRLRRGAKPATLARKSLTVRPSSNVAVSLRVNRKVAAAVRRRGRLKAIAALQIKAPDVTTRKDVAVTLRPAKR